MILYWWLFIFLTNFWRYVYTVNGIATAVLRAWNAAGDPVSGMAFITVTVDAQTISGSVNIQAVPKPMQQAATQ